VALTAAAQVAVAGRRDPDRIGRRYWTAGW